MKSDVLCRHSGKRIENCFVLTEQERSLKEFGTSAGLPHSAPRSGFGFAQEQSCKFFQRTAFFCGVFLCNLCLLEPHGWCVRELGSQSLCTAGGLGQRERQSVTAPKLSSV